MAWVPWMLRSLAGNLERPAPAYQDTLWFQDVFMWKKNPHRNSLKQKIKKQQSTGFS
jgi:hypothetical protein